MDVPAPNLRLLDDPAVSRGFNLASEVFHRINRVIPENQRVLTVPANCTARDAVLQMRHHGYSQVPVVESGEVLGVFSYRSFAKEAANITLEDLQRQKCSPGDLTVDEYLEPFEFARVTDELRNVFDAMDRDNGILIGAPDRLIGVLTPMDFLRYLYHVASPYVMISEIELALRALLAMVFTDTQLEEAARRTLASAYGPQHVPTRLDQMTFDNYQSLVTHTESWAHVARVLGGTRTRTGGKLREIAALRNDLFHFRRAITIDDHQKLVDHRNWLLSKVRQAEARAAETGAL